MTVPAGGTVVVMLWPAVVIITVVGVALPTSAWWLSRRMASAKRPYAHARMDAFGFPMDPIDTWFADHAELPALRRLSVRTAVFGGRAVDDESLRPVAQRLAAELLSGSLRSQVSGRSWRALAVFGAVELVLAAVLCVTTGHLQPWLASPGMYGVFTLSAGVFWPRFQRRRLEQSLRLNTQPDRAAGGLPIAQAWAGRDEQQRSPGCRRLTGHQALVAQRIEHLTTDQKVGGSSPSERAHHIRRSGPIIRPRERSP